MSFLPQGIYSSIMFLFINFHSFTNESHNIFSCDILCCVFGPVATHVLPENHFILTPNYFFQILLQTIMSSQAVDCSTGSIGLSEALIQTEGIFSLPCHILD